MKYQQNKTVSRFADIRGDRDQFVQRIGGQNEKVGGFQPVNAEIIGSDDTSITVKLQDGSSKIVLLSDLTSITQTAVGSKEDLKEGEKVLVLGNTNSDGSISAQSIQLNPPGREMFKQ